MMLGHLHGREILKKPSLLQLITISRVGAYVSVGSHHITTNLPEEPDYSGSIPSALPPPIRQLKRTVRSHFHPPHPTAKQTHLLPPLLVHLVLQSPLTSSVPVNCMPRHQSVMLHSLPHQKIEFFATCLKPEGLHLGVSPPLLCFSVFRIIYKLSAVSIKYDHC